MNRYAIVTEKTCLITKKIDGVKRVVSKLVPVWVGIVNPLINPMIMFTNYSNETILHTDDDIYQVIELLNGKNIKHKVINIENSSINFKNILY